MNNGFNIGNQNAGRIINIGIDERVKELEQQVSDLETALVITKNSRKDQMEKSNRLQIRVDYLEALIKTLNKDI